MITAVYDPFEFDTTTRTEMIEALAYIFGDEEFTSAEIAETIEDLIFYLCGKEREEATTTYKRFWIEHNELDRHIIDELHYNGLLASASYIVENLTVSRKEFINPKQSEKKAYYLGGVEIEKKQYEALPAVFQAQCEIVAEQAETNPNAPKRFYYKAEANEKFTKLCEDVKQGCKDEAPAKIEKVEAEIARLMRKAKRLKSYL